MERQSTAEEEASTSIIRAIHCLMDTQEGKITATKQQIKFIIKQAFGSTENALRFAARAEESGLFTLSGLEIQSECIYDAEKNLNLAAAHTCIGKDKALELKTISSSMFAVHPSNPFTASQWSAETDAELISRHRMERGIRPRNQLNSTHFSRWESPRLLNRESMPVAA